MHRLSKTDPFLAEVGPGVGPEHFTEVGIILARMGLVGRVPSAFVDRVGAELAPLDEGLIGKRRYEAIPDALWAELCQPSVLAELDFRQAFRMACCADARGAEEATMRLLERAKVPAEGEDTEGNLSLLERLAEMYGRHGQYERLVYLVNNEPALADVPALEAVLAEMAVDRLNRMIGDEDEDPAFCSDGWRFDEPCAELLELARLGRRWGSYPEFLIGWDYYEYGDSEGLAWCAAQGIDVAHFQQELLNPAPSEPLDEDMSWMAEANQPLSEHSEGTDCASSW